jgi:competence protein ComEC
VVIWERQQLLSKKEFIVFHKSRESITGIRNGRDFRLRTSIRSINRREPSLNTYMVHEGIKSWQIQSNSIGNTLKFDQESILIVDSLSFYKTRAFDPTIIILQNSPKINLERLIAWHHPKLIVADGSNYKSYVKKWEVTCSQKKTPFHSTLQKGAFILKE